MAKLTGSDTNRPSWITHSVILTDCSSVTDGQTNGRTN